MDAPSEAHTVLDSNSVMPKRALREMAEACASERRNSEECAASPGESEMSAVEALQTLKSEVPPPRSQVEVGANNHSVNGPPLLGLFDNSIVQRLADDMDDGVDHTQGDLLGMVAANHRPYFRKGSQVQKALKALMPSNDDLKKLFIRL
ncbi:hypothetical protein MMC13_003601 [Lambiella insularis]|nr:hypothetical protein [Lambiella insularis]